MHIGLVIERYDPSGGGAERSTAEIARELVRRGHAVTVLAGRARPEAEEPGVRVVRWSVGRPRGAISLWAFGRWVRRELRARAFDTSLSVTTAAPAVVVQPRGGTVRETLERNIALRRTAGRQWLKRATLAVSPKHQLLLRLEQRTLTDPMVQRMVAVSGYVVEQLERHYQIPPARVTLIPNAAQMPAMTLEQQLAARQRVRAGFAVPEAAVGYLFAALNPKLKGLDPLLKAARRLVAQQMPVVLLLAGEIGYAYQRQVVDLGLREHVRFIGRTDRIADLYCAADVTVLPTFYDPASKVVIESLMLGVPAITTKFNGAADLLTAADGARRGRVVADPADDAALAAAMAELADPAERARCRAAAAGLAAELGMARHVDQLERVLQETASPAGATPEACRLPS